MSQKVEIVGREMEVTDRIRDYVTKKVAKIERHFTMIEELRVELEYAKSARSATDRYVAQITLRGKGLLLRSEERADDIRTAMDAALEKISRRLDRFKGKRERGRGDGKSAAEVAPEPVIEEAEEILENTISRRKTFDLVPMDESEAIEQMHMLGHDNFFIFYNVKTSSVNVVYRRTDGTYGLIEPRIR